MSLSFKNITKTLANKDQGTAKSILPDLSKKPLPSKKQLNICISSIETIKTGKCLDKIPAVLNPKWDQRFEIKWEFLPKNIAKCLNQGRRLDPRDKREFVRFICRAITDVCAKPKRKNLVHIVQKIVEMFPNSLADTWCDETAGSGYESLLKRVVNRIENFNRVSTGCKTSGEKKKRHPLYKTYGCSNFEPGIIEDENELENKREVMKNMYANGSRDVSVVIKSLLQETYKLQRKDINEGQDIEQLISDWPFLFSIEGLLVHFIELVGIDVRGKLENVLVKGNSIIAFMSRFTEKCLKRHKVKNTLFKLLYTGAKLEDEMISDMNGILVLIMEYFEEKKDSLFVVIESAVPCSEVEQILSMQNITSPVIVVHGHSEFSYDKCMLYVKGKIVIKEIKTFKEAFIGLFCIYYCLNIEYPLSAAATLEFIQRCFFSINPEYGAKVKRFKWKMNTKVTKLIEMLGEYEAESVDL